MNFDDLNSLSDEELMKLATETDNREDDLDSLSDEELMKLAPTDIVAPPQDSRSTQSIANTAGELGGKQVAKPLTENVKRAEKMQYDDLEVYSNGVKYGGVGTKLGGWVNVETPDGYKVFQLKEIKDGRPVLEDMSSDSEPYAVNAEKGATIPSDVFDALVANKNISFDRTVNEQIRLGLLAETGNRHRYSDDDAGAWNALKDRAIPFVGTQNIAFGHDEMRGLGQIAKDGNFEMFNNDPYLAAQELGLKINAHDFETKEDYSDAVRRAAYFELYERVKAQDKARRAIGSTERDDWEFVLKAAAENIGFQSEFAVGGAVGKLLKAPKAVKYLISGGLPAVSSFNRRYSELTTDDFAVDENGNLIVEGIGDSKGKAVAKAAAGAIAEVAIESFVGDAVGGAIAKGAGKILSKGKWTKPIYDYMKQYKKVAEITQLHNIPSEMLEENIQAIADDLMGLGKKDSEYMGLAKEWEAITKEGGMFSSQGQWDTFLGLIGLMGAQTGAVATHVAYGYGKQLKDAKDLRERLALAGVSEEQLNQMSARELKFVNKLYNKFMSDPESMKHWLERSSKRLAGMASSIVDNVSADLSNELAHYGLEDVRFNVPTKVEQGWEVVDGVDAIVERNVPDWQSVDHINSNGGITRKKALVDDANGVAVEQNANGTYTVKNMENGREGIYESERDALAVANMNARYNALQRVQNEKKVEFINNAVNNNYRGKKIQIYSNVHTAFNDINNAFESGGKPFGLNSITDLFNEDFAREANRSGGVHLPDGTTMLFLDQLKNAKQIQRVLNHETVGHMRDTAESSEEWQNVLKNVDPKSEFGKLMAGMQEKANKINKEAGHVVFDENYVRSEAFAQWLENRRFNPSLATRFGAKMRDFFRGENRKLTDGDLELMAQRMQAEANLGTGRVEFITADNSEYIPVTSSEAATETEVDADTKTEVEPPVEAEMAEETAPEAEAPAPAPAPTATESDPKQIDTPEEYFAAQEAKRAAAPQTEEAGEFDENNLPPPPPDPTMPPAPKEEVTAETPTAEAAEDATQPSVPTEAVTEEQVAQKTEAETAPAPAAEEVSQAVEDTTQAEKAESTAETPIEATESAPVAEETSTPVESAESAEGGISQSSNEEAKRFEEYIEWWKGDIAKDEAKAKKYAAIPEGEKTEEQKRDETRVAESIKHSKTILEYYEEKLAELRKKQAGQTEVGTPVAPSEAVTAETTEQANAEVKAEAQTEVETPTAVEQTAEAPAAVENAEATEATEAKEELKQNETPAAPAEAKAEETAKPTEAKTEAQSPAANPNGNSAPTKSYKVGDKVVAKDADGNTFSGSVVKVMQNGDVRVRCNTQNGERIKGKNPYENTAKDIAFKPEQVNQVINNNPIGTAVKENARAEEAAEAVEAPKAEAPKVETPKAEVPPKAEAPKTKAKSKPAKPSKTKVNFAQKNRDYIVKRMAEIGKKSKDATYRQLFTDPATMEQFGKDLDAFAAANPENTEKDVSKFADQWAKDKWNETNEQPKKVGTKGEEGTAKKEAAKQQEAAENSRKPSEITAEVKEVEGKSEQGKDNLENTPKADVTAKEEPSAPAEKKESATEKKDKTAKAKKSKPNKGTGRKSIAEYARQFSYEAYEEETGDHLGAELLIYRRERGQYGLLNLPDKRRGDRLDSEDMLVDWVNNMLDGNMRKKNRGLFIFLFGRKVRRGSNDLFLTYVGEQVPSAEMFRNKPYPEEALIEAFLQARDDYSAWVDQKKAEMRENKVEEAVFFDEVEANLEDNTAAEADYYNALGVIEQYDANHPYIKTFNRESLMKLKRGDRIWFDHETETDWIVWDYDAENNVMIVANPEWAKHVTPKNIDMMEAEGDVRKFALSENGFVEINPYAELQERMAIREAEEKKAKAEEERLNELDEIAGEESAEADGETEAVADEDGDGNAESGKQEGTAQPQVAGEEFQLEAATPEQLTAEKERQKTREEISRRQNEPLKGQKGEVGQGLLDLGGMEGEDLFNRTVRNEPAASTPKIKLLGENKTKQKPSKKVEPVSDAKLAKLIKKFVGEWTAQKSLRKMPAKINHHESKRFMAFNDGLFIATRHGYDSEAKNYGKESWYVDDFNEFSDVSHYSKKIKVDPQAFVYAVNTVNELNKVLKHAEPYVALRIGYNKTMLFYAGQFSTFAETMAAFGLDEVYISNSPNDKIMMNQSHLVAGNNDTLIAIRPAGYTSYDKSVRFSHSAFSDWTKLPHGIVKHNNADVNESAGYAYYSARLVLDLFTGKLVSMSDYHMQPELQQKRSEVLEKATQKINEAYKNEEKYLTEGRHRYASLYKTVMELRKDGVKDVKTLNERIQKDFRLERDRIIPYELLAKEGYRDWKSFIYAISKAKTDDQILGKIIEYSTRYNYEAEKDSVEQLSNIFSALETAKSMLMSPDEFNKLANDKMHVPKERGATKRKPAFKRGDAVVTSKDFRDNWYQGNIIAADDYTATIRARKINGEKVADATLWGIPMVKAKDLMLSNADYLDVTVPAAIVKPSILNRALTAEEKAELDKGMAKDGQVPDIRAKSAFTEKFNAKQAKLESSLDIRGKSAVTPEEDAEYLRLAKNIHRAENWEKAERMVREAAAKAMPNTKVVGEDGLPLVVYHGMNNHHFVYGQMQTFHTSSREVADTYGRITDGNFINAENVLEVDADGNEWISIDTPSELTDKFSDGDTVQDDNGNTYDFDEMSMTARDIAVFAKEAGYDGVVVRNVLDDNNGDGLIGDDIITFNPVQVKSADPVTRDDDGNVIPLSERFNPKKTDIRWDTDALRVDSTGGENFLRGRNEDHAARRAQQGRSVYKAKRRTSDKLRQEVEAITSPYLEDLITSVSNHPRPVSDAESVVLNAATLRLSEIYDRAAEEYNEVLGEYNGVKHNPILEPEARIALEYAKDAKKEAKAAYDRAYKAYSVAGTETARALNARKAVFDRDYSFLGLYNALKEAKGGRELNAEEQKELEELAKVWKGATEDQRAVIQEAMKNAGISKFKELVARSQQEAASRPSTEAGHERMLQKYNEALAHLRVTVAQTGNLLTMFGNEYGTYNRALQHIVQWYCYLNPSAKLEEVRNEVFADLSAVDPSLTMDDFTLIWTGYGRNWQQNRTEAAKLAADLRSQQLELEKQKDLAKGELPKVTGGIREEDSYEKRLLRQITQKMMRDVADKIDDPKFVEGVLKARKTFFKNRIEEKQKAIEKLERIPRSERKTREDAELLQLKAEYEAIRKMYDETFGLVGGKTLEERLAMSEDVLMRSLQKATDRLRRYERNDFRKVEARTPLENETIRALREQIKQINQLARETKLANNFWRGMSQEETNKWIEKYLQNLRDNIKEVESKLLDPNADWSVRRPAKIPFTAEQQQEFNELQKHKKKLRHRILEMREKAALAKQNPFVRSLMTGVRMFNMISRVLRGTADVSVTLRQCAQLTLSNPKAAAKIFAKHFGAFNEQKAIEIDDELRSDPLIKEAIEKGYLKWREFERIDRDTNDEVVGAYRMVDKFLDKIPGIKNSKIKGMSLELLNGFERLFVTYANAISAHEYRTLVSGDNFSSELIFGQNHKMTEDEKREIGYMINIANGMSNLNSSNTGLLSNVFWAPKLALTRIQQALGYDVAHALLHTQDNAESSEWDWDSRRKMAALVSLRKAKHLAIAFTVGMLIKKLFGSDDDWEEFKKLNASEKFMAAVAPRVYDINLDLTGGQVGIWRLVNRLLTDKKKSSTGKVIYLKDKDEVIKFDDGSTYTIPHKQSFGASHINEIFRFLQGKISPLLSTILYLKQGKDYVGEEFGWKEAAKNTFVPLTFEDTSGIMDSEAPIGTKLLGGAALLTGAGGTSYKMNEYANLVNPFLEAKKEYDNAREDRQLDMKNKQTLLQMMKDTDPLMADEHRERIGHMIKQVRKAELQLKKAQQHKASEEVLGNIQTAVDELKAKVMQEIRKARK